MRQTDRQRRWTEVGVGGGEEREGGEKERVGGEGEERERGGRERERGSKIKRGRAST